MNDIINYKDKKKINDLIDKITTSINQTEQLQDLSTKELADLVMEKIWGEYELFEEKSIILTEVIDRLMFLDGVENNRESIELKLCEAEKRIAELEQERRRNNDKQTGESTEGTN